MAIEQYISSQEDVRFKLLGKLYFSYYMYPESEFVWLKPEDNFEIAAIEYLRKSMLMVVFDSKNGEYQCKITPSGITYFDHFCEKSYLNNSTTFEIMNLLYRNFSETGGAENINISFEKGSEKEDILSYLKKKGYIGVVFDKETECNSRITIEGINFFERQFGEAKGNIYEQYEISRLQEELKELHKILHEVIRRG